MKPLTPFLLRYGADQSSEPPISLTAGALTMIFDPARAFLRYIRIGDHEVVRCVYAAIRDRNWNTIEPELRNLRVDRQDAGFQITFDAVCGKDEIDFVWKGTLSGTAEGKVSFGFDGVARSTFLRNRIGICVLHPILECAGKPCSIEKVNGTVEHGLFPRTISPHQPFKQIRAISNEPVPGVRAEVRFGGDVFEMEDQRNWTDASFKTYGTPLEIPFPVEVSEGARIQQSVTVTVPAPARRIMPVNLGRGAQLSISTTPVLGKPRIGLCVAGHGRRLSPRETARLKALNLSHLRAEIHLASNSWIESLHAAAAQSAALGTSLHLALFLTDNAEAELTAFASEFESTRPNVSLWIAFHESKPATPHGLAGLATQKLSPLSPNILIAAGSSAFFAELNRNRPPVDSQTLPCYSINPQVHAFDNPTLIENLAAQIHTLETTQDFAPRSVVISPITLKPRLNPNATCAEVKPTADTLPPEVDPRQMSLFGAAWTLGSIARLSMSTNLHSLTYFETTGRLGVMETESAAPLPDHFPSISGCVFPVYHLLEDLADCNRLYPTHSSHPLQVDGITLLDGNNRRRILVANFLGETQEIKIKTGTCTARVRYLDETNCVEAMRSPEDFRAKEVPVVESAAGKIGLKLLPCAFARVDIL